LDGRFFIIFHLATVSDKIDTENCGEFTLKTFFRHCGTPFEKVSNSGTHDVSYFNERSVRWNTEVDSAYKKTFQISGKGES
jgi:hypothetical protein